MSKVKYHNTLALQDAEKMRYFTALEIILSKTNVISTITIVLIAHKERMEQDILTEY